MFGAGADFDASVPEDTAVGTAVGNPIVATDSNDGDILSYELSGDDEEFFNIDIATGQLTVAMALDHEAGSDGDDGVYEITITAFDPSNDSGSTPTGPAEGSVQITATDVNEKPRVALAADTTETLTVPENHAVVDVEADAANNIDEFLSVPLGTYVAEDDDEADMGEGNVPKLSLAGDDAAEFVLSDPIADDETNAGAVELRFKAKPNFEAPTDANQDNAYKVTIVATDKKGLKGTKDLTVEVMNIDEPGSVGLSNIQPGVGQAITATLTDPDGGVSDMKWQWARALAETGGVRGHQRRHVGDLHTYSPGRGQP